MRKLLQMLAIAGIATITAGVASAQDFSVRVGVGDPGWRARRVVRDVEVRPIAERRYIERRRIVREPARVRTVCRTVIRERVRPSGVVVRRPTEVCREIVVGGRRTYID